jgi:hypothetical protein
VGELVAANDDGDQAGHLGDSACKERLERGKSGVERRVDELRLSERREDNEQGDKTKDGARPTQVLPVSNPAPSDGC